MATPRFKSSLHQPTPSEPRDVADITHLGCTDQLRLARSERLSAESMVALAEVGEASVRAELAARTDLDPQAMLACLQSRSPYVHDALVRNRAASVQVLTELTRSVRPIDRIAQERLKIIDFQSEQLTQLAEQHPFDVYVRIAIKAHPACPPDLAAAIPF